MFSGIHLVLHKSWSNHKYFSFPVNSFCQSIPLAAKKTKNLHLIPYFTKHNNKIIYFFTPTSMSNCQNNPNHPTPQPSQSLGPSFHKTHTNLNPNQHKIQINIHTTHFYQDRDSSQLSLSNDDRLHCKLCGDRDSPSNLRF